MLYVGSRRHGGVMGAWTCACQHGGGSRRSPLAGGRVPERWWSLREGVVQPSRAVEIRSHAVALTDRRHARAVGRGVLRTREAENRIVGIGDVIVCALRAVECIARATPGPHQTANCYLRGDVDDRRPVSYLQRGADSEAGGSIERRGRHARQAVGLHELD